MKRARKTGPITIENFKMYELEEELELPKVWVNS
jgi:hypothetical protein